MPSRSNRLRARRALGGDAGSDSASASASSSDEVLSTPTPAPKRSTSTSTSSTARAKSKPVSRSRSKGGKGSTAVEAEPGRLKRLLALLLVTTLLLTLYHVFRLYTKGQGILGAPASLGRPFSSSSFAANKDAPGGMIVHPSPPAPALGNEEIRLEDLDMETLQAAFDALYGDGGPLGPGSKRGDGSGEYRVAGRRKESLH